MNEDRNPELAVLIARIEDEVSDTRAYTGRSSLKASVLEALREVPRHVFVPPELQEAAYQNRALPIGCRQTISQPYVVALMSDLIEAGTDDTVLEIGTGSGYQAAILARLVKQVYSMEIIEALAGQARERLHRLQIDNVEIRTGNGRLGWPEHAPYDAIVVTAATPEIPPALIGQLKPGGRIVIPLGDRHFEQNLTVIHKDHAGRLEARSVLPVVFVPLTGPVDEPDSF